jgi:membrane protease YdiL (CAAX protease family)
VKFYSQTRQASILSVIVFKEEAFTMKFLRLTVTILFFLAIPTLGQLIASVIFGIYARFQTALSAYDFISSNLALIVALGNTFALIFILYLSKLKNEKLAKIYRFNPVPPSQWPFIVLLSVMSLGFSLGLSGLLNLGELDVDAAESLEFLITGAPIWITLFSVGIWVPIVEEIVFRGAILRVLSKEIPIYSAIILQALLFGLFHGNLIQLIPTSILGITLGLTVYYSNSILPAIVIHMLNNTLVILLSLSAAPSEMTELVLDTSALQPTYSIMIVLFGTGILLTLRALAKRRTLFIPEVTKETLNIT